MDSDDFARSLWASAAGAAFVAARGKGESLGSATTMALGIANDAVAMLTGLERESIDRIMAGYRRGRS